MSIYSTIREFAKSNKKGIALGSGALALGGVTAYALARRKRKSRNKNKNRKSKRYNRKVRRKYRKTPHTAGKRRDRSIKRIRYTKNGQPYVIMASGKARFIKKKSAKSSHKRRGGRY